MAPVLTVNVHLGGFPSGQWGQTVNLLAMPSVVRIHLPPPKNRLRRQPVFSFVSYGHNIIAPSANSVFALHFEEGDAESETALQSASVVI